MGSDLAPLIAVVGSDGSGKSTLSADLLAHIRQTHRAEAGYLGLGSGEQGRRIGRWPIVGPPLHRFLDGIADRLRDPEAPIPGQLAARYALRRSHRRWVKFEQLVAQRRAGITVVTDRYPQLEVPGLHDGPILAGRAGTPRLAAMQAEERALYADMAAYVPTLVIRLHVDVDTVMARKPDHDRELITRKVETVPLLAIGGAPIVDIDATIPYAEELTLATGAVDAALAGA